MAHEKIISIDVPDNYWKPTGQEEDPTARLLTTVFVNGTPHHLEAYAVKDGIDYVQAVIDRAFESNYEGMCMASEPNGRYETTEIMGRDYVLMMTPHC
jgi:hypothetical protein